MSKKVLQPFHIGIENVELFEKTRLNILRQSNSMYLENNSNYNIGFNHAWVALQGAASESAVESVALKKALARVAQLEAEVKTLESERASVPTPVVESGNSTSESTDTPEPVKKPRAPRKPKAE